jgi:hypothetical protein
VIHAVTIRFDFSNPILALSIPSTGNISPPLTKLINLRRVSRKIIIDGYIADTTYDNQSLRRTLCHTVSGGVNTDKLCDGSARAVALNGTTGAVTYDGAGCTAVDKAIIKKWILEQLALAGTESGKGLTVQWRGIKNPSGTDCLKNDFFNQAFITELTISDDARISTSFEPSQEPLACLSMPVKITLVQGSPTTGG